MPKKNKKDSEDMTPIEKVDTPLSEKSNKKTIVDVTTANRVDWNISTLVRMMDKNSLDFSIQRGLVWEPSRDSILIHSILIGWPIGVFYFNKTENGVYECLDSQQRGNAVYEFVKGNLKLSNNTPPVMDQEGNFIEVAKKNFKDLPEEFQDRIYQYGLLVYCFDNMTIKEKVEFFKRINSGKPVTAADISRIKVKSRKIFQALSKHKAMETALTKKARARFVNEDIVKNLWIMCFNESKSLLDKDTSSVFEEIEVSPEQETMLNDILKYINLFMEKTNEMPEIRKKVRAKTHIASLGYLAYLAITESISENDYIENAIKFFKTDDGRASISEAYNGSITGGAKPEKVIIRIEALKKTIK